MKLSQLKQVQFRIGFFSFQVGDFLDNVFLAWLTLVTTLGLLYDIFLLALAGIAFMQNMAFTWVSRSRNSADPGYHRYAAWGSNGVWALCQMAGYSLLIPAWVREDWLMFFVALIVYTTSTTEGSVIMMKALLRSEKGKRMVGART